MRQRKNKYILLLALGILVLVTCGFGKSSVELLQTGLIDLDAAISAAPLGVTEEGVASENEEAGEDTVGQTADGEDPAGTSAVSNTELIVVSIRGEKITVDGENVPLVRLRQKLLNPGGRGAKIRLVDDYADAEVYRTVREILEELSDGSGISYTES